LAELEMHGLISQASENSNYTLVEVGANILRTEAVVRSLGLASRVHLRYLMPDIMPGDERRAIATSGKCFCKHKMQECTCAAGDYLIGSHVAYYATPQEHADAICKLTKTSTAYHIVHTLDSAYGSICHGQLRYKMDHEGYILAAAANDNHTYRHQPNGWMACSAIPVTQGSLVITRLYDKFDVQIYRFQVVAIPCLPISPKLTSWAVAFKQGASGDATSLLSSITAKLTDREICSDIRLVPSSTVRAFRGDLLVHIQDREYAPVSKSLVARLAATCVGSPRTPTLYRTLCASAERTLKTTGCPDELLPNAKMYAAIFAMFANLEAETALLGRAVETHRNLIATHNRALDFQGVGSGGVFARLWWWTGIPKTCMWQSCCESGHESEEARFFSANDEQEFHGLVGKRLEIVVARPFALGDAKFPVGAPPKNPDVPPLDKTASISLGPIDVEKIQEPNLQAKGIVFSDYVPTTVAKTQENAYIALRTRILAGMPEADESAWDKVGLARANPSSILHMPIDEEVHLDRKALENWLDSTSYSENRKRMLRNAWDSLDCNPLTSADMIIQGIIKDEKGAPDCDAYPGTTPRGVYSNSDRALVCSAPVIKHLAATARRVWGTDSAYCWVSGMTGLQYGRRTDAILQAHPDWVCLVSDHEKFEAHRSKASMWELAQLYMTVSKAGRWTTWVEEIKKPRKVVFGKLQVKAKVEGKFWSGGADTSFAAVADNGAGVYTVFGEPFSEKPFTFGEPDLDKLLDSVHTFKYMADLNGDDDIIWGPRELLESCQWAEKQLTLGFETSWDIREPHQAEFCRSRPWPSSLGTYWSVMIGRTIARLGWALSAPQEYTPLAVATGLKDCTNHVPFVRVLIARMIEIGGEVTAAKTHDWAMRGDVAAEPTGETWDFCYRVYGLTQADEEDFRIMLASIKSLPCAAHWGYLRHCLDVDDS